MIQKTLRFYPDSPEDITALNSLMEFRKYGFQSAREMVIKAINEYTQKEHLPSAYGEIDVDALANLITDKIRFLFSNEISKLSPEDTMEDLSYNKALEFIESL